MLRRLALRDFVIVAALEVDFGAGFTVLTGETGAGKSILIDALQPGDRVRVRRSQHQVRFLHPRGWSYYATLREKLHWYEG